MKIVEEPRTQKSMWERGNVVTPYTCLFLSKMLVLLEHYTLLQLTFRLFWINCSVTEIITLLNILDKVWISFSPASSLFTQK